MDDAQAMMDDASYYVKRLARELQDVHRIENNSVEVNPGGFLHFADYFFDDLFVDWAVQSQINKAFDGVTVQHNQVEQLQYELQRQLQALNRDKSALEEKRRGLLEEG